MRMTLDAASGGTLMNSPQDVAYNLIEEMAKNHHSWGSVRQVTTKYNPKTDGICEVNVFDHMNTEVDSLYQKIDSLNITPFIPTITTSIASVSPALSIVRYAELIGIPIEIVK